MAKTNAMEHERLKRARDARNAARLALGARKGTRSPRVVAEDRFTAREKALRDLPESVRVMNELISDAVGRRNQNRAWCVETPLLSSPVLDTLCGCRVFVKAECLQRSGSFKYRGALNALLKIKEQGLADRGVVAFSSGNHAAAVARAASDLGIDAKVVMPDDAPRVKVQAASDAGATIVTYSRSKGESRESVGGRIAREEGRTLVKPFDDCHVIAGQGTCGVEIACQLLDSVFRGNDGGRAVVLIPTSGGGLAAGISVALKASWTFCPSTKWSCDVWCVEPHGLDDHARSLAADGRAERLSNPEGAEGARVSLCDALMAPQPGKITWDINRHTLKGGVTVSDDEVLGAMRLALTHLKLVLEPGGASALGAILNAETRARVFGESPPAAVVVVASGGNVDPDLLALAALSRPLAPAPNR